mgnify:FL=1|jgi:hypothetical protein|tara:strand:+ start:563 stop:1420 length:858 start_codon:yes stop_codon:yes gene_type:complete
MSRNKQRTAAATDAAAATTAPATPAAPATLSYVTPTEFVELPSRGKFYPSDHSLHNKEVIEMRFMTAKDEDILTSPALLRNGLAIDRLIENLIVETNVNVNDLLLGDKNAVILAARISGYGEQYNVNVTCPNCEASIEHQFDLSEIPHQNGTIPEDDNEDVYLTPEGTFVAKLPKSQFSVEFKLLTGQDEEYLEKVALKTKKLNLPEASATNLLKRLVVSVNDVNVTSEINNFIDNMPAQDARFLRACVVTVTPNVDMTQEVDCSSCGTLSEMAVPFTSEFFWPN